MSAFVYGVLGAVLCIAVFIGGVYIGMNLCDPGRHRGRHVRPEEISAEEAEQIRLERENIKAVNDHFAGMMRYNSDTAYCLDDPTERMGSK